MYKLKKHIRSEIFAALSAILLTGCANEMADKLNPFAEDAPEGLGQRNSKALMEESGGQKEAELARHAFEVMQERTRTQAPQPYYPVVKPAEVRLMWVPDHVNKAGDLVPAHYYFLRVLEDRWAVQDEFELEDQLKSPNAGSATPWKFKK